MEFVRSLNEKDKQSVSENQNQEKKIQRPAHFGGGCPGSRMRLLNQDRTATEPEAAGSGDISFSLKPQLQQWPVSFPEVRDKGTLFSECGPFDHCRLCAFCLSGLSPQTVKRQKGGSGLPQIG